jgi:energy-coupling factor transporter transmembrane protein EcfT
VQLAYDYPVLGVFWTMFVFFIWIMWFFLLFRVIFDIFRSPVSGLAKVLWFLLVLFLPFLGVFIYIIVNGNKMGERDMRQAQAQEQQFRSYVQEAAGSASGPADQLAKLADLRDRGVISEDEFNQQKAKILA